MLENSDPVEPAHARMQAARHFPLRGRVPAWVLNGLTVTLGLALDYGSIVWAGGVGAAQTALAAAVCVSLADVVTTPGRVASRVFAAIAGSTASAVLFLAVRPYGIAVVPTVALIIFGAMMMLSWGPKAGSVAFGTALSLVFAMSLPESPGVPWGHVAWGLAGACGYWIWAVVSASLLQPAWRTLALASTADGLSGLLRAVADRAMQPADAMRQAQVVAQEAALADRFQSARDLVFASAHGPTPRMQASILLHLVDLRDLALASTAELDAGAAGRALAQKLPLFARAVNDMARSLAATAVAIRDHEPVSGAREIELSIERALDALESIERSDGSARGGMADVLRGVLEHIRAIHAGLEPGSSAKLPCESIDLRLYVSRDSWHFAAVRSDLRIGAPVFRHALRTSLLAGAAFAALRVLPWAPHPQWVVLTIVAVMQGSLAQTSSRRDARVLGTLVGCAAVLLLTFSPPPFFVAYFLVASGIAHAFFGVRYSVTAGGAAVMAVLQAHLVAPMTGFGIVERFADTVAGALLGWGATYVFPNWERQGLPKALGVATSALGAYAAEAMKASHEAQCPRIARQHAYDALRSLGEARSRSLVEPSSVRVPVAELTSWLSAAYVLMSHLSSVRVALVLYGRNRIDASVAATMAMVSHRIASAFAADASGRPLQVLEAERELVLATVPGLQTRVHRALTAASRLVAETTRLEAAMASDATASAEPLEGLVARRKVPE
jgi:uncharacterized membrane protein YccC